jgi:hypothetical protein
MKKEDPDDTTVYSAEERFKSAMSVIARCAKVARKRCEHIQRRAANAPDLHTVINCKHPPRARSSRQAMKFPIAESPAVANMEVVVPPHTIGSLASPEHPQAHVEDVFELSREQYLAALRTPREDVLQHAGTSLQAAKGTCIQQQTTHAAQDFFTSSLLPDACSSNSDKVCKDVELTPMLDTSFENMDKLALLGRATASRLHTHQRRDTIISAEEVDIATFLQQLASPCGVKSSIAIESRLYLCNKIFKNIEHRINVENLPTNVEQQDKQEDRFATSKRYTFSTGDTFSPQTLSLHCDSQTHFLYNGNNSWYKESCELALRSESHTLETQNTSQKHTKKAKTGFCSHCKKISRGFYCMDKICRRACQQARRTAN